MPELGHLLFGLVFCLVIVAIIAGSLYSYLRRKKLMEWASQRGLVFDHSKHWNFSNNYPFFGCLRKGSRQYAFNTMTGTMKEFPVMAFDYHYETYSRDSKGRRQTHHHYFSGLIIRTPYALKPLFIRPESMFDKISDFFGYNDIDFESSEFSRRFYVKAEDKKWAYDVLHARAMQMLLEKPVFTIEFGGSDVIAYLNSRFSTEQFDQALDVTCGLIQSFPNYLAKEIYFADPNL